MTNRLLQMSSMELHQSVVQELSENPALETVDESACSGCSVPGPQCGQCPTAQMWLRRDPNLPANRATPIEDEPDPVSLVESPDTLQDFLSRQLGAVCPHELLPAARYLVANIDDDGYLRCTLEEAGESLQVSRGLVEQALSMVQLMEPTGVGARTLQECLLLQARALGPEAPKLLVPIIQDRWKEMTAGRWASIARSLRVKPPEVEHCVAWLRKNLSPYPGQGYRPKWGKTGQRSRLSIRPDVMVHRSEVGHFELEVAREELPVLQLNPEYARIQQSLRDHPEAFTPAERKHIQEYLERAQMFLKSLKDRGTIVRRVAEMVLDEQRRYFETELEEDLMPLTQAQLSTFLRVHESTVSRAVADKYLQLPSGRVVPLSFFFDRSAGYRRLVANLVASEDPTSPLSDQEISDTLRRQGVQIARRTVMKYREEQNILSSRQRARLGV